MRRTFLDTNVFLYAFLNQDTAKKPVAARIMPPMLNKDDYLKAMKFDPSWIEVVE